MSVLNEDEAELKPRADGRSLVAWATTLIRISLLSPPDLGVGVGFMWVEYKAPKHQCFPGVSVKKIPPTHCVAGKPCQPC